MKIEDKFWTLVELAWYGIEWVGVNDDRSDYDDGGIDTIAHQIACAINQWYGPFYNGVPTCETRDELKLDDGEVSKEEFVVLLQRYITLLQEENKKYDLKLS